ncbi:hypothetical protein H634G_05999 [Metarhizium anisopliae BRIP 53293]|uniref:Zn(2)-C6 fungal-type domain-containing protein n=1 Tax=Metarhizium anisopliae BRIP 53293 TaxID=1291518 RepID=A0A0D9NX83_METAN|nr:hypothetical protein H634G_05999 [Metarhizium anisopliae BRIP 53293]
MDLDPRLRLDHGGQRSPLLSGAVSRGKSTSTPSPSSQVETASTVAQHRPAPYHVTEAPDSPPADLGTPNQQQNPHGDGNDHDGGAAGGAAGTDAKKSRACEACRGLKVRCEPDPDDEAAPCKRCKKAGRSCVVTVPTRKRQKKTDSRVSELEKKIDALTASLQARAAVPGIGGGGDAAAAGQGISMAGIAASSATATRKQSSEGMSGLWINSDAARTWAGSETGAAAQGIVASPVQQSHTPRSYRPSVFDPPEMVAGHKRKATEHRDGSGEGSPAASSSQWPMARRGNRTDIIDRGLVSLEAAAELFQRYKEHMLKHLPAVVFPPTMSVMELRRSKPYLFLAIMAAASSETHGLQRVLQRELMELFAEKIVIVGEKNLELIQALHIAVIWYWPPEHFEELKFYQLVHMSAVMALDIGLGKKSAPKRGITGFSWREHPFRRHPQPDPISLECRRTWLTCHFLAANTAMSLHRPNLIRWSPFMTESLDMLSTSPDAYPTDRYLCHLIWTHRMAEDIGVQLSMDDPDTAVNIMDARTQYTLRGLERDLNKYIATVPKEMMQHDASATLKMSFSILNLYMHELALHSDNTADAIRPPFATDMLQDGMVSSEPLSAAHINALSACLSAIDTIFQTFLAMDVFSIRCLPVFTFVRVAYAVVILMKMYFSASSPSSELGKVINKDNMRVAYYLEALLEKFSATAADDKCRPASKFLLVLVMLRTWFLKHGKADTRQDAQNPLPAAGSSSNTPADGGTPSMQPSQPLPEHAANTPLQVLSEVAMGRESNTPRPFYNSISGGQAPPQNAYYAEGTNTPPQVRDPSAFPQPWMAQPPQPSVDMDMTVGLPANFDFESLGVPLDQSGDLYGGGAKMAVLNDPLFSDMFQGLPDPNFFSL